MLVSADRCCFEECFARVNKFAIDAENLNFTAISIALTRNGEFKKDLIKVVETSMDKCRKEMKLTTSKTCNVSDSLFLYTQCVFKENYRNCPNVTVNEKCRNYGQFIKPCMPATTTTTSTSTTTPVPTQPLPEATDIPENETLAHSGNGTMEEPGNGTSLQPSLTTQLS